jgi:acetyl esterase/lipase
VVAGSSSGGQLAAMVAGSYGRTHGVQFLPALSRPASSSILTPPRPGKRLIHGVLLRGPVTCDASDGGVNIPPRFRPFHTSMRPEFHTSLASKPAVTASNRTMGRLPLESNDFGKMPRHWIQVSTNDIYYSDGVLYTQALKQAGVEVRLDIVQGFPHTFWLKAPELERAVKAEKDMIAGLRWLLESEDLDEQNDEEQGSAGTDMGRNFVPFTDEEFERRFLDI